MRTLCFRCGLLGLGLLLVTGCGRDSVVEPAPPSAQDEVLDPDPDGMELPGAPEDEALASVVTLAPTPVPESQVQGSLLTTRLRAILAPGATVGQVNEALTRHDAAIVSMNRGVAIVVLVIDPVADLAEAEERARAIADEPAFAAAFPARSFRSGPDSGRPLAIELPEGLGGLPDAHLVHLRMPAAWNARSVDNGAVRVLLADHFPDRTEDDRIEALRFSFYGGFGSDAYGVDGNIVGNDGVFSAGLVGGDWDTEFAGIHPGPGLQLIGIPVAGLDLWEVAGAIRDEMTLGGDRFVLLTGLTFREVDAELTPLEMATMALSWRLLVRGPARDFEPHLLHVMPGGDQSPFEDDPPLGTDASYWSVSASYADLRAYLASLDPTDEEAEVFDALLASAGPDASSPMTNALIVGASGDDGQQLPMTASLTDVRVHGRLVWGPCAILEETASGVPCDGEAASYIGTFAAAPQVAGLGAYLWSLSPSRSSFELGQMITDAFVGGFVDAYRAVLALDPNLLDPRVRDAILDPNDDGRFDEVDVRAYLDAFATSEGRGDEEPDYSRYDLNGDGYTGTARRAAFDLDADGELGQVEVPGLASSFGESAVTDLDILCYCTHTDLYFGDEAELPELLPDCLGELVMSVRFPETIAEAEEALLEVRAGYEGASGDTAWTGGIQIELEVDGGTTAASSGVTDAEGWFRTSGRLGTESQYLSITVTARNSGGQEETETVVADAGGSSFLRVIDGVIRADAQFTCSVGDYGPGYAPIVETDRVNDRKDPSSTGSWTVSAGTGTNVTHPVTNDQASALGAAGIELNIETFELGDVVATIAGRAAMLAEVSSTRNDEHNSAGANGHVYFYLSFEVVGEPVHYELTSSFNGTPAQVNFFDEFLHHGSEGPISAPQISGTLSASRHVILISDLTCSASTNGGGTSNENGYEFALTLTRR